MKIVFTDLDGTLLDHETYSFEPARPALDQLKERGIPMVLASSKTAAEMAPIAEAIGIDDPMIVENGAGVVNLPGNSPDEDGVYARLREVLDSMPSQLRAKYQGFGDWSDTEVAEKTGLPLASARLARPRRFSELKRSAPDISQRMLTKSLTELRRDGYITRKVYPTQPPQVEYALTEAGSTFLDAWQNIVEWAKENQWRVHEARDRFDWDEAQK